MKKDEFSTGQHRVDRRVDCTPSALNGDLLRVAPSGKPGPGVCTFKKSTVDLTGKKSVRKGCLVSWGGLRFTVLRVEGGRAYYGEAFSNSVACGLVQVVG